MTRSKAVLAVFMLLCIVGTVFLRFLLGPSSPTIWSTLPADPSVLGPDVEDFSPAVDGLTGCLDRFSFDGASKDHPAVLFMNRAIPHEPIGHPPDKMAKLTSGRVEYTHGESTEFSLLPGVDVPSRCLGVRDVPGRWATYGTLMRHLASQGIRSAQDCCKTATAETMDMMNRLYEPFLELPPPDLVQPTRPIPLEDLLDCSRTDLSHVLTGKRAPKRRKVIDLFIAGHELDLGEARLFELDGVSDAVFIYESSWSHRGGRKTLFFHRARNSRFQRFTNLHIGNAAECDHFMDRVQKVRHQNESRERTLWGPQMAQRSCLKEWVMGHIQNLDEWPDDTLIINSDLDEIPNGEIVYHLSHCEIKDTAWPLQLVPNGIWRSVRGITTKPCCGEHANAKFNVETLGVTRQVGEPSFRKIPPVFKGQEATTIRGAVHMTSHGSQAVWDYKGFNYGEGGGLHENGIKENNDILLVTEDEWCIRHENLADRPYAIRPSEYKPLDPYHKPYSIPSRCLQYQFGIPWAIIENPERFSWNQGLANYDDLTVPWNVWLEATKADGFADRYPDEQ